MQSWGLIEGFTLVLDSMKIRAINSRKNNVNQARIERQRSYLADQIRGYFSELEKNDGVKSSGMSRQLDGWVRSYLRYGKLEKQLAEGKEKQLSFSDPESRLLPIRKNLFEVSYALQTVVDASHKLICHLEVKNGNDREELAPQAIEAKELLKLDQVDLLADKGYFNGSHLAECEAAGIRSFVSIPKNQVPKP